MSSGIDPAPAKMSAAIRWAQEHWEALHGSSAGGAYANMMMEDEGRDRVRAAYRGSYDRLALVKRRYDPTNLFHLNHNIPRPDGVVDPAATTPQDRPAQTRSGSVSSAPGRRSPVSAG
jgi:hypothetical protein